MCMIRIDKQIVQGELAQLLAQIDAAGQAQRADTAVAVRERIAGMRALLGTGDLVGDDYHQHRDILELLDAAEEYADAIAGARPAADHRHLHA